MDITNKTRKPLSLPLPGGKRLFLGPGKTGQVSPRALEHPPLVKLLEAGDIETAAGGPKLRKGAMVMLGRLLAPAIVEPVPSANPETVEALFRRARPLQ